MACGYDAAVFWDSTPREIQTHFEAFRRRAEREHRARGWLAWHVAALYRAKRLPKLEDLIGREKRRPLKQSLDQMRNAARMITMLLGGSVTKRRPE